MATRYWRQKGGSQSGANNGTSLANAYIGFEAVVSAVNAGTLQDGDTIEFDPTEGAVGFTDKADYPATSSSTTALGSTTAAGGLVCGTSQNLSSSASNITWDFKGGEINMQGATTSTQRMVAALRLYGEGCSVKNLKIKTGNWAYHRNPSNGSTRVAGGGNAEDVSDENGGLLMLGNKPFIDNLEVDGGNSHCRWCVYIGLRDDNLGGTPNTTGELKNMLLYGAAQGIKVASSGGSGEDWEPGTRLLVHDFEVHTACWGKSGSMSLQGYNAARHGNGIGCLGNHWGGVEFYDFKISGEWQDAAALIGGVIRDGLIENIGAETIDWWVWNSGTQLWQLNGLITNPGDYGNGVKFGLGGSDGASPTDWMGLTGGSAGGTYNQREIRSIAQRLRIYNCQAHGVTMNDTGGHFLDSLEIDDTDNAGISTQPGSGGTSNVFICNTYVRKVDNQPSNYALWVRQNTKLWLVNSAFVSNPSVSSQRDVFFDSSNVTVALKDKNLLGTGRSGGSYTQGTDLASPGSVPSWTRGFGWDVGSTYRSGGRALATLLNESKCSSVLRGLTTAPTSNRAGRTIGGARRSNLSSPPIGPYV